MNKKELSQEINHLHANICSAISDPTRILLLYAIAEETRNVNSLAEALEISQSAASRHLKVLRERGIIEAQRDGTQVLYTLTDERYIKALNLLREVMLDRMVEQVELINHSHIIEKGSL
ncbi:MAG: ArsR/SmtB family transcription factor [Anaerolineales bacterium]